MSDERSPFEPGFFFKGAPAGSPGWLVVLMSPIGLVFIGLLITVVEVVLHTHLLTTLLGFGAAGMLAYAFWRIFRRRGKPEVEAE